jgi:Rad3-related DNA helicases
MEKQIAKQVVKISVRNLIEFLLRTGDIDNRVAAGGNKEAMQLGNKIHRKIQRKMGSNYRAEVSLSTMVSFERFDLRIEGRADGIIEEDAGIVIDEIKGVFQELETLGEVREVHKAQAKCYAYIYALQDKQEAITVQITYAHMETEEVKRFRENYTFSQLEEWFLSLVGRYEKWANFQVEWKETRDASIRAVAFPFVYRSGQRELVTSVYKSILRKKKLFIQAPTGVGKTMATIFPGVKAMGEGLGEKLFYLTAKTITRTVAFHAFELLKEQDLRMKVVVLTAKDKICFCEERECNPEHCIYAKGHYDRINEAVYDMLISIDNMSREKLEEYAKKHRVCPFELSLDITNWVDAVICDYNYVFDPVASLKHFFAEGKQGGYLFLVDEAHNLVERARSMYSAQLYKEDFLQVRRLTKGMDARFTKHLEECNQLLLTMKRTCENYEVIDSVSHLILKLMNLMGDLERFLEECKDTEVRKVVLEFYFQVRTFLYIHERLDHSYIIYDELESDGRFKLKLFCVNPANNLEERFAQGNSTILFSATFLPIQYYKELLSVKKDDYAVYAQSAFDAAQSKVLIGHDVSTKYTRRNKAMYDKFVSYILQMSTAKQGNYLVFFPSYKMMLEVYECFMERREALQLEEEIECILQSRYMGEEAREIFLENFEEDRAHTLLGFCIMGGIFSEGIDLVADRLIGAAIIGTGLPQVCNERELLKQYFEERAMPGFDFAYLYPGMNKVLQAAGRVIRSEEDTGVILLLDERFKEMRYQEIFPREWENKEECQLESVQGKVEAFWRG